MATHVDISSGSLSSLSDEQQARICEELRMSRAILQQQQPNSHRIPGIPTFSGEASKGVDYHYWRRLVKGLQPTYADVSIIQSIRKSITGLAAQIIGTLEINCSLDDILNALDTAFDHIHDEESAQQKFYNAVQGPKASLVEWYTRLTTLWMHIPDRGTKHLQVKKRLWNGLRSSVTREASRAQFDNDDVKEVDFVKYLRRLVEGDNAAPKVSVNAVQVDSEVESLRKQVAALTTRLDEKEKPGKQDQAIVNQRQQKFYDSNYQQLPDYYQPAYNSYDSHQPYNQYQGSYQDVQHQHSYQQPRRPYHQQSNRFQYASHNRQYQPRDDSYRYRGDSYSRGGSYPQQDGLQQQGHRVRQGYRQPRPQNQQEYDYDRNRNQRSTDRRSNSLN